MTETYVRHRDSITKIMEPTEFGKMERARLAVPQGCLTGPAVLFNTLVLQRFVDPQPLNSYVELGHPNIDFSPEFEAFFELPEPLQSRLELGVGVKIIFKEFAMSSSQVQDLGTAALLGQHLKPEQYISAIGGPNDLPFAYVHNPDGILTTGAFDTTDELTTEGQNAASLLETAGQVIAAIGVSNVLEKFTDQ